MFFQTKTKKLLKLDHSIWGEGFPYNTCLWATNQVVTMSLNTFYSTTKHKNFFSRLLVWKSATVKRICFNFYAFQFHTRRERDSITIDRVWKKYENKSKTNSLDANTHTKSQVLFTRRRRRTLVKGEYRLRGLSTYVYFIIIILYLKSEKTSVNHTTLDY